MHFFLYIVIVLTLSMVEASNLDYVSWLWPEQNVNTWSTSINTTLTLGDTKKKLLVEFCFLYLKSNRPC